MFGTAVADIYPAVPSAHLTRKEPVMNRTTLFAACGCVLLASVAQGQVVVSPVVTTYYPPAPVVSYYAPSAPVVAYDVPTVAAAPLPVTTYYTPAAVPVTTYYVPTTAYYAPATTTYYGGTAVVAPVVVGRPVTVGSSLYGTWRPYVVGQPVRNTAQVFRAVGWTDFQSVSMDGLQIRPTARRQPIEPPSARANRPAEPSAGFGGPRAPERSVQCRRRRSAGM